MVGGMRVELLGTMRVLIDGKPLPKLRSRKAKWLLALLVLRGGKPIGRPSVASTLWPDSDLATALTNLRSVVSDLRRALGVQAERLDTPDRRTIAFDFENVEIDVLAFDAAILTKDLEPAVALYTGPLLQDCDEEWAGPERSSRERAYLAACHDFAEKADPAQAIDLCLRAVELSPLQDGPRRDLMSAYVRAGDTNAALAVYRDFAQALRAETGSVPDPQTADLYMRLRRGRSSAAHGEAPVRGSLPHAFSSFVGREDERDEIVQAIRSHRLVTLTGVGGIGKTRLAREVAFDVRAENADGVGFVALEAVQNDAALVQALVAGLGIQVSPNRRPMESLVRALRSKRFLLLLDNCEHLLCACAGLADRLLAQCPQVRILATSREPLGLVGEKVWRVPGLSTPDPRQLPDQPATTLRVLKGYESVRLFVERAQSATKEFELTRDNALAVAELCALLEGSPLALELAAGRTRTIDVADIVERFRRHRLDFLTRRGHAGAPRHQTLRSALDWSHSLLGPDERRLFARLAVFADGWTLDAAEAVAGATSTRLESLVEKSLVRFLAGGRYGFLETVREYAGERLATLGERPRLTERHANYYADLAERLAADQAPNEAFEREMGNFNAVMDRTEVDPFTVLCMTKALHWYWQGTYSIREGARRVENALARSEPKPSSMRAHAFRSLAIYRSHSNRCESVALHEESLRIWTELGDRSGMVRALSSLGLKALFVGDTSQAAALNEESVAIARDLLLTPHETNRHVAGMLAYSLNAMAMVCTLKGDFPRAKSFGEESLELMRTNARPVDAATVLNSLGLLSCELGDYDAFRRFSDEALDIYRAHNHPYGAAWCLVAMGNVATELGRMDQGRYLLEEALRAMRKLEDPLGKASALEGLGTHTLVLGDVDEGRRMLSECLVEYQALNYRFGVGRTLDGLGEMARRTRNLDADSYFREALSIWKEMGAKKRIRDTLLRIGDGAADPHRSARLWAFAHRLGESIGAPVPLLMRKGHERAVRGTWGEPGFDAAWVAGEAMSLDEALDLANRP